MNMKEIRHKISGVFNPGLLKSGAVVLFLLSIVLLNQMEGAPITLFYYMMALFCAYLGFFPDGKKMELPWIVVLGMVLVAVTGILNIALVGNSTVNKQLFTLCAVGIGLVFLSKDVDDRVFLVALVVNAAVVAVRAMIYGTRGPLYVASSANFVSVHMLIPVIPYYVVREMKQKKLVLWPAFLAWGMCLLAQGRAGILFCTFFVGCLTLVVVAQFMTRLSKRTRMILILCGVATVVLIVVLGCVFDVVNKIGFLARFSELGFGDNGRFLLWGEYFDVLPDRSRNILLGVDEATGLNI